MEKIRYPFFDSIRGFALVIMAIYHFSFDLNQFGVIHENMNRDPFWLNYRALILTLFLSLVGVSFAFSKADYQNQGFRKRLLKVGVCALIISIGTYFANSSTWIFFGILQFIFIASLLGPLLIKAPRAIAFLGIPLILLPLFYRDLWFHQPLLNLTGLSPVKPTTEDFVPLLPWLGVVMVGVGIGFWVLRNSPSFAQKKEIPALSKLGQHSLVFYMTHQLVLYPLAWAVSQIL